MDNQRILDRIISGYAIVEESGQTYIIRDPTPHYRQLTNYIYDQAFERVQKDGSPTQQEALAILIDRGIWSDDKEKEITTLQDNIKKLRKQIPSLEYRSVEKKKVLWMINLTENRLQLLNRQKNGLFNNTAEYLAGLERYKYYLFYLTFDLENKRVWTSLNTFIKTSDALLNKLITKAYFNEEITEVKVRALARSDLWRSLWVAACKTGNIFGNPMSEATDLQRLLITWSLIYDSVFESPDCPANDVIENDILLDQWLEQQQNKRNQDKSKEPDLPDSIKGSAEIGIVVDTWEDAQRVYKLNDSISRGIVKSRSDILKDKGTVREIQLPDVKQELQMQLNRMSADKHKGM